MKFLLHMLKLPLVAIAAIWWVTTMMKGKK